MYQQWDYRYGHPDFDFSPFSIAKGKFCPRRNLQFAFLGFFLEKSCKSVVRGVCVGCVCGVCGVWGGAGGGGWGGVGLGWGGGLGVHGGPLWPTA